MVSRRTIAAAAVVLGGALTATADVVAQARGGCAAPAARAFDFWVGEWDVLQRILRRDGTYLELPASTAVSAALDGCALVERWSGAVQFFWEGMDAPAPMKGLSVRAYDPDSGEWSIHWMDTRSPRFGTPYVGGFSGGRGVFYREWEMPRGSRTGRITFSDIARDAVRWSLAVSDDGRQSWTVLWTMDMRRKEKR